MLRIVQTSSRVNLILRMWFKLMTLSVKEISFVFHLANAQKCGFLTLVVLISWCHIWSSLTHLSQKILVLFIWVVIKHVLSMEYDKLKFLWTMVACKLWMMSCIFHSWEWIWSLWVLYKKMVSHIGLIEIRTF